MPKSRSRRKRSKSVSRKRSKSGSRKRSRKHRSKSRKGNDMERMKRWKPNTRLKLREFPTINCKFLKFTKTGSAERAIKNIDKYGLNKLELLLKVKSNSSSCDKLTNYHDKPIHIAGISTTWYIIGSMGSCDDAEIILRNRQ